MEREFYRGLVQLDKKGERFFFLSFVFATVLGKISKEVMDRHEVGSKSKIRPLVQFEKQKK